MIGIPNLMLIQLDGSLVLDVNSWCVPQTKNLTIHSICEVFVRFECFVSDPYGTELEPFTGRFEAFSGNNCPITRTKEMVYI